ncbi:hypothetical protein ILP97_25065 [Amycolatopsis sp. H6(2020)]|nr:hypothetical protein [Amycolatopsis sp. H6(2020)]
MYVNRSETKNAIQWGSRAVGFLLAGRLAVIIAAVVGSPPVQNIAAWVVDRGYCLAITQRIGSPVGDAVRVPLLNQRTALAMHLGWKPDM